MRTGFVTFLTFAVLVRGMLPALAQDQLPPGPGRDETRKACSGCHGVDIFTGAHRSSTQWEITIQNMINAGAKISDDEFDVVLTYLATYQGLTPPPPPPAPAP